MGNKSSVREPSKATSVATASTASAASTGRPSSGAARKAAAAGRGAAPIGSASGGSSRRLVRQSSSSSSAGKKKKKQQQHQQQRSSKEADRRKIALDAEKKKAYNGDAPHSAAAALKNVLAAEKASETEDAPHPAALALQAAMSKPKPRVAPTGGADGAGTAVHPMAAMFNKAVATSGGDSSEKDEEEKEFTSPIALRKVGPPSGLSKVGSLISDEGEMDEVRAKAIADAKRCRKEATEIYPWLRVSGDWVARNMDVLKEAKVTHILNMAHTVCENYHGDSGEFSYLALDVIDSANEPIICFLLEAIDYIELSRKKKGVCFVHCHMGVSRSCTVVIAYLMWKEGMRFQKAFDKVKELRPTCNPNAGFVGQLMEFDRQLHEMPKRPELYRVARHSKSDSMLILKLCYDLKDETKPATARPTELDGRGLFVLHDYENRVCWQWVGPRCEDQEEYAETAERFTRWLIKYMPSFKDHELLPCQDQPSHMEAFWIALGVSKSDAKDMEDSDVNINQIRYDDEYGGEPKKNKHQSKISHRSSVASKRSTNSFRVMLYSWVELEDSTEKWDRVKEYDADDLLSESMSVLLVHDKDVAEEQDHHPEAIHRAFIWIGSDLEGRLNEDAAVSKAKGFIKKQKAETKSSTVEVHVEQDDHESETFWSAFEAGY